MTTPAFPDMFKPHATACYEPSWRNVASITGVECRPQHAVYGTAALRCAGFEAVHECLLTMLNHTSGEEHRPSPRPVLYGSAAYTFLEPAFRKKDPLSDIDIIVMDRGRLAFDRFACSMMYHLSRTGSRFGPVHVAGPTHHAITNHPFRGSQVDHVGAQLPPNTTPANPKIEESSSSIYSADSATISEECDPSDSSNRPKAVATSEPSFTYTLFVCGQRCVDLTYDPQDDPTSMISCAEQIHLEGKTFTVDVMNEFTVARRTWEVVRDPSNWRCDKARVFRRKMAMLESNGLLRGGTSRAAPLWMSKEEWTSHNHQEGEKRQRVKGELEEAFRAGVQQGAKAALGTATSNMESKLTSFRKKAVSRLHNVEKRIQSLTTQLEDAKTIATRLRTDRDRFASERASLRSELQRSVSSQGAMERTVTKMDDMIGLLQGQVDSEREYILKAFSNTVLLGNQMKVVQESLKRCTSSLNAVSSIGGSMVRFQDYLCKFKHGAGDYSDTATHHHDRSDAEVLDAIAKRTADVSFAKASHDDERVDMSRAYTKEAVMQLFIMCTVDEWIDRNGGFNKIATEATLDCVGVLTKQWLQNHIVNGILDEGQISSNRVLDVGCSHLLNFEQHSTKRAFERFKGVLDALKRDISSVVEGGALDEAVTLANEHIRHKCPAARNHSPAQRKKQKSKRNKKKRGK